MREKIQIHFRNDACAVLYKENEKIQLNFDKHQQIVSRVK